MAEACKKYNIGFGGRSQNSKIRRRKTKISGGLKAFKYEECVPERVIKFPENDYSSGTCLNGRKRVSHLANKGIKQELNQAARSAIQWDRALWAYAERKLENKSYGAVLNNVKFKLILRMFAIVKRQKPFVDKYKTVA